MTSLSAQRDSVLRHPNVLCFIGGRFLASLGAQIQVVAVGWQMYDITGDPLDLGLIGLSQFIPFVTLIFPAGHAADNHNRARIVTTCYLTSSICALALLVMTLHGLLSAWPIFMVMMVLARLARSRCRPRSRCCRTWCRQTRYRRAVALNSSSQQVATIIGPAVGRCALPRRPVGRVCDGNDAGADRRDADVSSSWRERAGEYDARAAELGRTCCRA